MQADFGLEHDCEFRMALELCDSVMIASVALAMAFLIRVSAFSTVNGVALVGGRTYYAVAQDSFILFEGAPESVGCIDF